MSLPIETHACTPHYTKQGTSDVSIMSLSIFMKSGRCEADACSSADSSVPELDGDIDEESDDSLCALCVL